jgi:hypothetical protein
MIVSVLAEPRRAAATSLRFVMRLESPTREFLIWILGISTAASIIMLAVMYTVDYLAVVPKDSLTTQAIRVKGSDAARRGAMESTVEEIPTRYITTTPQ